jgi:hypothetical protein
MYRPTNFQTIMKTVDRKAFVCVAKKRIGSSMSPTPWRIGFTGPMFGE